jgi:hypothetical protein
MRIRTVLQLACFTFLLGGCGETADTGETAIEADTAHMGAQGPAPSPSSDPESVAAHEAVVAAVVEDPGRAAEIGPASEPWSLDEVTTALESEPDLVIGALDEPQCEMFGSIRDVAVDGGGRVFVLDAMHRTVRAFGNDGECLFELGGEGSGPGELREPVSLDLASDGRLRILDMGNGRIEQFDVSGAMPRRLDSVPVPVQGIDLCTIADRIFVAARSAEFLLYELDDSGAIVRATGTLDDGQYMPVHAPEMALCGETAGTILLASRHSAELRWFRAGGGLLFQRDLPEFAEAMVIERDGRSVGYGPGPNGLEQPASFLPLAGGNALLQTGLPRDPSALIYLSLKTYRIALDSGDIERLEGTWPHIFATRDSVLVAATHDMVPRIGIWRRSAAR